MTYRAKMSAGWPLGVLFIALVIALDALLLNQLVNRTIRPQQINLASFLTGTLVLSSIPLLILLAYHTLCSLTLRYHVNRNNLVLRWLGTEETIPMRDIQRIAAGPQLSEAIVPHSRRGVHWPGHEWGEGMLPDVGPTRFLASRPWAEQLVVVADGQAYAISPHDPDGFLRAFESRQALGPNRLVPRQVRQARWLTWPFWKDRTAWVLLGAALAVNLALFAYLSARFPSMDLQLPLHFNIQGMADRIGTKAELFALPIIGLIILVTNSALGLLLYSRERAGAYLLWGGAAMVQVLFWLAVLSIGP